MITAQSVKRMLSRFGGNGTLKTLRLDYDGSSGREAEPTTVVAPFTAVEGADKSSFGNGIDVAQLDLTLYMSCSTMPAIGSEVVWADKKYAIKAVRRLAPNGVSALMYTVGLVSS